MPASLKQIFLSVRRKLEEDYVLCAFCRNNGELPEIYITHEVSDTVSYVYLFIRNVFITIVPFTICGQYWLFSG